MKLIIRESKFIKITIDIDIMICLLFSHTVVMTKLNFKDNTGYQIIQINYIRIDMVTTRKRGEDSSSEDNTNSSEDSQCTGDTDDCGDEDEVQKTIDTEKDRKIQNLKQRVHELEKKLLVKGTTEGDE